MPSASARIASSLVQAARPGLELPQAAASRESASSPPGPARADAARILVARVVEDLVW